MGLSAGLAIVVAVNLWMAWIAVTGADATAESYVLDPR
jgi:hypothetical protein